MESEQAERILKTIADSLEEGKGFVVDQAPDVVQQLVVWGRARSAIAVAIPLVVALAFFVAGRQYRRKWNLLTPDRKWDKDDWPHQYGAAWVSAKIVGWLLVLIAALNTMSHLQVWLAPKLYALEYLFKIAK